MNKTDNVVQRSVTFDNSKATLKVYIIQKEISFARSIFQNVYLTIIAGRLCPEFYRYRSPPYILSPFSHNALIPTICLLFRHSAMETTIII